ncbi:protein insensitive-like isoform X2 [Spodoptera litura]|nr:protein insensitive-like isoform X2 [Spodoptera litura]
MEPIPVEAAEAVQAIEPVEPAMPEVPIEPVEPAVHQVPIEAVAPMAHVAPLVEPVVLEAALEPLVPIEPEVPMEPAAMEPMVPIGSGQTLVPLRKFLRVKWDSYTVATRSLLRAVFSQSVLATHSLTGKRSPAFLDRPVKACLDAQIVEDIVTTVQTRFKSSKLKKSMIRKVITTKCADECKMLRMKENRPPGGGSKPP